MTARMIFILLGLSISFVGAGMIIALCRGIDGVIFGAGASAIVSVSTFLLGRALPKRGKNDRS